MPKVKEYPKDIIKFKKVMDKLAYAKNTQKMYLWQVNRFRTELETLACQQQDIQDADIRIAMENYLVRIRAEEDRSCFLQACAGIPLYIRKILNISVPGSLLKKLQAVKN